MKKKRVVLRFLTVALLIINAISVSYALDPPTKRITEHRAWMRSNFPGKDASLEEKLGGIADIFDFDLQEVECLALMEYMRNDCKDFAPYPQELEDFIRNHGSNAIDDLGKWKRGAIAYYTEFAKHKLGRFHPVSVRLRLIQIDSEASYHDCVVMAKAFADSLEVNYKRNPSRENLEMATVSKVLALCIKLTVNYAPTPDNYLDILRLEKDVLSTFPARSEDNSYWRSMSYLLLGDLKTFIDDGVMFDVATMGTEFEMETVPDDGTDYSTFGKNKDVISNVQWYFIKAAELVESRCTPNHPATNIYVYRAQSFSSSNFGTDPGFADALNDTYTYFKLYYPENNIVAINVRISSWVTSLVLNQPNQDLVNAEKLIPVYKRSYGEDNPHYISGILPICVVAMVVNPASGVWEQILTENESVKSMSFAQKGMNRFYIYNQLMSVVPDMAKAGLAELCEDFLKSEEMTYENAQLGRSLVEVYNNILNDFVTASNLANKVQQVSLECGGVTCPFFQNDMYKYIEIASGNNDDAALDFFKAGRDCVKLGDARYKTYFENRYNTLELDYYFYIKHDYTKSKKLVQSIIKGYGKEDSILNSLLAKLALSIFNMEGKTEESDRLMSAILKKEMEQEPIQRDLFVLELVTQYYTETFQAQEANKAIDAALEGNDAISGGLFDDVYLRLREWKGNALQMLGDKNAQRRIFSEDLDNLENSPFYVPTMGLLSYIWSGYYVAKQDNRGDFYQLNYFIQKFIKYMLPLYQSSSDKESFEFDYVVPLMTEMIDIYLYWKSFIEANASYTYPAELLAESEKGMNSLIEVIKSLQQTIEEKIPGLSDKLISTRRINAAKLFIGLSQLSDELEKNRELSEKYLRVALEIAGEDAYVVALVESSKAEFYKKYGEWEKAMKSFEISVAEANKRPYLHFEEKKYIPFFNFSCCKETGNYPEAIIYAKDFYRAMKEELDSQFQLMTATDQENFMAQHGDPVSLMSTMLEYAPEELACEVYDGIIYRTGMQLRSQQSTLRAIESSDNPELKSLVAEYNRLKLEHSRRNQLNASLEEGAEISTNVRKIQRLEQQIFDLTADARKDVTKTVSWKDVANALTTDAAAIEFAFSDKHIVALILKAGCKQPVCVNLCKHESLQNYLQETGGKNTAALAKKLYGTGKNELYQLLWSSMEPALKGVKTIYLSAPGILNSISFNAISTPDGGYIFDKYDIRQLTTTAELVKSQEETLPKTALLAGDILFSLSQQSQIGKMDAASRDVDMEYALDDFDQRGAARQYFRYLPYTGVEIDDIGQSLKGLNPKYVRREDATEAELRKHLSSEYDILHLATHGFFLTSDVEALKVPYMKRHSGTIGSSMQRAGIALAGAEESWKGAELPEEDDGILTAMELSGMNLKGVKLAVLSACETALGNYSFEGIYGLPRGLKQAGVEKLMVSLWSVNDHSTSLFMSRFYESWIHGSTPHTAYRSAVQAVREKYPEPFYWAPFILLDGK